MKQYLYLVSGIIASLMMGYLVNKGLYVPALGMLATYINSFCGLIK